MYVNLSAVSYRVQMGASDQGGVTGSWELPHMGAGNLNQFLCRGVLCSSLLSHHWSAFVLIMQLLKYHDFKMPLTLEEHITLMPFQPRWTTRKTLASLMIACPSLQPLFHIAFDGLIISLIYALLFYSSELGTRVFMGITCKTVVYIKVIMCHRCFTIAKNY